MLAFAWIRHEDPRRQRPGLSKRLSASLCAGVGGHSGSHEIEGLHFAYRPLRSSAALARSWSPACLPSGRYVIFHGYFDNAEDIASELRLEEYDLPSLYGQAVEKWGDTADRRIIGEYCSVIADPVARKVRLARSPLRAPPLHYSTTHDLVAASSVPRALFAAGVERRLNEDRVADSAIINFTDLESSWYKDINRVPVGCVVELEPEKARQLRQYYDVLALPRVRMPSDAAYLARASELLDEGVRACLNGFDSPGATLSAGLDSPQVAVRAVAMIPSDQKLPTFTFHPEPEFEDVFEPGSLGNERPFVEKFVAMHPKLEPHFTANEGYEHDHRWNEFFHLMGCAPSGLCNMYVFHGLLSAASKRGCDLLLLAEWGNYTFSDKGDWGYVEYLLKGRWIQLWRALSRPNQKGSIFRRFVARTVTAFLPNTLWRPFRRLFLPGHKFLIDLMQPLSETYRHRSGADDRLKKSGIIFERYQPWSARHAKKLLFQNDDAEAAEIYQAFEQMYGVAMRDPMSHRPFVEFCFGLPTNLFMRDGTMRWMAKQLAKGVMPEEQRANLLNGRWDSDWHLRLSRRREEFLVEIDRIADDPRLRGMLDVPRLRHALVNWPDHTPTDPENYFGQEFAVPRGLLTARFINWVEGRNEP